MEGDASFPLPSKGVADLYLELILTLILGNLVGNSYIWPTKSVEVWDWELSWTADKKIIGIFWNATSQPVFRFDLCSFFDNNELMAEWESYSPVHLGCGTKMREISFWSSPFYACPANGPTHCHKCKRDYHCSTPGCETESDQGGHKDPFISIQRVYPSRDCKPGTYNPFTLKIMAWNELSSKYCVDKIDFKFKNFPTSGEPGIKSLWHHNQP